MNTNKDSLREAITELLKDYNGYDFCGEIACNGQGKATELTEKITTALTSHIEKAKAQGIEKGLLQARYATEPGSAEEKRIDNQLDELKKYLKENQSQGGK